MLLKVSTINSGIVYIHSWKVYAYLTEGSEIKHSQLCHRPVPKHSRIGQGTSFCHLCSLPPGLSLGTTFSTGR